MRSSLPLPLVAIGLCAIVACGAPSRSGPSPSTRGSRDDQAVARAPSSSSSWPSAAQEPIDSAEALALAKDLVDRAKLHDWRPGKEEVDRAIALGLDERRATELAAAIGRDCLAQREVDAKPCAVFSATGSDDASRVGTTLIAFLGEAADPKAAASPAVTLLVRLDARGQYRAGMALERLLTRRARASRLACAAPQAAEIAAASSALADFLVVEPSARSKPGPVLTARAPTRDELDDLAYFYAAVATNGAEVGVPLEDRAAPRLAKSDPAIAERGALSTALASALLDGDLAKHEAIADRYLRSLGYPGPIRVAEDGDPRWGGAGFSFVMRDAARTAELLGHVELAASLYRRAEPGGGMCGTSTASRRDDQIAGVIRATEASIGCRGVVAELLFASALDGDVGPARLGAAGFDVERLYRGALLTANRADRATTERAFASIPSAAPAALDRLRRLGVEAWSDRVRAVAGYADAAGKGAVPRLLAIAEAGAGDGRVEAVRALGDLVHERGFDPCGGPSGFGWGSGGSSSGERPVSSVMHECDGSVPASEIRKIVQRLGVLAKDPDVSLRAAVAKALGQTGVPEARGPLASLARDKAEIVGSQVCRSRGDGPSICQPNRPVRLAAQDALEALEDAAANRKRVDAERRARRAEEARREPPSRP